MIRPGKVEALVLSRRKVGEGDRLLTIFTEPYGLLKVVAKGVRKIPSRRGGHVEPWTRIMSVISGTRGRYFLTGAEMIAEYPHVRTDVAIQEHVRWLTQAIVQLLEEQQPYQDIYTGFTQALSLLGELPETKRWLLEATLLLYILRCAGWPPRLTACHICGRPTPSEAIILDGTQGGWHCLTCHQGLAGTRYSVMPELLKVLRFLERRPEAALAVRLNPDQAHQL